jgi:uncharacterized protein YbjT (DUF2867 family)
MKVLVTGGTGVVGPAAVRHLLDRGHSVRVFARHAEEACLQWPGGVEPHNGDVADPASVRGSADRCEAILHLVGVVAESPPEVTLEKINVEGTRHFLAEANRARVHRFVYVSSLGADRGRSTYHRSKKQAEELVRAFPGDWLICRAGNVYGPGDAVISLLLKLVRTLPAIPVPGGGDDPFQPIWVDDLGRALALAVERADLTRQTLELAGLETVTLGDVLDHLERLTGKSPARLPLPGWIASAGTQAASLVGLDLPVHADQITMLLEGNIIQPGRPNALVDVFGLTPTPLAEGLTKLADSLPEQLPSEGTGRLFRRRYWADIRNSSMTPDQLMARFCERFAALAPRKLMKVGAEPGTPTALQEGTTLTMALPMRGNVQVRVEEIADHEITFVTLEGHPLAGAIRFLFEQRGDALHFEVQTYDRSANVLDRVAMGTFGRAVKAATWKALVNAVVRESGGVAPSGVQTERGALDDEQAARIEEWIEQLVLRRKREARDAERPA